MTNRPLPSPPGHYETIDTSDSSDYESPEVLGYPEVHVYDDISGPAEVCEYEEIPAAAFDDTEAGSVDMIVYESLRPQNQQSTEEYERIVTASHGETELGSVCMVDYANLPSREFGHDTRRTAAVSTVETLEEMEILSAAVGATSVHSLDDQAMAKTESNFVGVGAKRKIKTEQRSASTFQSSVPRRSRVQHSVPETTPKASVTLEPDGGTDSFPQKNLLPDDQRKSIAAASEPLSSGNVETRQTNQSKSAFARYIDVGEF